MLFYGSDPTGMPGFIKDTWGNFDIIAEHWYAQGSHHWDLEKAKSLAADKSSDDAYVKWDMSLLESARYPADTVRLKAEEWQGYQKRFPQFGRQQDSPLHRRVRLLQLQSNWRWPVQR